MRRGKVGLDMSPNLVNAYPPKEVLNSLTEPGLADVFNLVQELAKDPRQEMGHTQEAFNL